MRRTLAYYGSIIAALFCAGCQGGGLTVNKGGDSSFYQDPRLATAGLIWATNEICVPVVVDRRDEVELINSKGLKTIFQDVRGVKVRRYYAEKYPLTFITITKSGPNPICDSSVSTTSESALEEIFRRTVAGTVVTGHEVSVPRDVEVPGALGDVYQKSLLCVHGKNNAVVSISVPESLVKNGPTIRPAVQGLDVLVVSNKIVLAANGCG